MDLSRFLDVLRAPGVLRIVLANTAARLPYGMLGLALILLLREEGLGYGAIGTIIAAEALAVGLSASVVGRLVDRVGQTRVLVPTALLTSTGVVAITLAARGGAGVAVLAALALVIGATTPPVAACTRALWPQLAGRERLDTAFALDAVQLELIFVVGPALAAGIATLADPAAAALTCAALHLGGGLAFASTPASRAWRPVERRERRRGGALRTPGIRILITVLGAASVSFGVLEVAIPAFAESHGSREAAGPLLTAWAVGSVTGGVIYGARAWPGSSERRLVALTALLAVATAPLALAGSVVALGALLVLTGLTLAPLNAVGYALVGGLAPDGAETEAFSWQIVANVTGGAIGAWLGGVVVEGSGVTWALGAAAIATGVAFLLAVAGRTALRPAQRTAA